MTVIHEACGNHDNLTEAVHGLNIFTKNWCMNCEEKNSSKMPEEAVDFIRHRFMTRQ